MVPAEVLATGNGYAIAVYAAIAQHADRKGQAYPSIARLQQITGWSRPTIDKAIKVLCDAGSLVKINRAEGGMKRSNAYVLPSRNAGNTDNAAPQEPANVQTEATLPTIETSLETDGNEITDVGNDVGTSTKRGFHKQEPLEQEPTVIDPPVSPSKSKPKQKRKPMTFLPDDWGIGDDLIAWADERGYTLAQMDSQVERFKNNAVMKQHRYADWDRAFQNWMNNARDWGHLKATSNVTHLAAPRRPDERVGKDGLTDSERGWREDPGHKGWSADEMMRMAIAMERADNERNSA